MNRGDPEQELIQFVLDRVETVPHLEALLLIWQNPSTGWTADVLAGRIYVSQTVARGILEDFRRDGALRAEGQPESIYFYIRDWDARQILPRLADLYRRQLVQVTKLIHSKGSSSVREFARAFQIKKDH